MNNAADRFLSNYEAHAELSRHKRYARRMPTSVRGYHDYYASMEPYYSNYNQEPYVEMYIPQHRFQELVERDLHYSRIEREIDYASRLANQELADKLVRESNPAVKNAYEKYMMLLELTRK